jgi:hypothetical protein
MRYEPIPGGLDHEPGRRAAGKRPSRISWRVVGLQAVGFTLIAWALTAAFALVVVVLADRTFVDALRFACAIMAAVVIAFGLVATQRGPIPFGLGGEPGLIRPVGPLSQARDIQIRPLRTSSIETREEEHNGLTAFGAALVVAPQLIAVASVL